MSYHRLTIWTSDDVLFNKYTTAAETHNSELTQSLSQSHDFNSGFDLIVPTEYVVSPRKSLKLSHQIVCKMKDEKVIHVDIICTHDQVLAKQLCVWQIVLVLLIQDTAEK